MVYFRYTRELRVRFNTVSKIYATGQVESIFVELLAGRSSSTPGQSLSRPQHSSSGNLLDIALVTV